MTGWIKIHRDLANHWIAQDMEKLGRWLDLLMYASHTDNKALLNGKLVEVKRGQMVVSFDFLAKRWNCSKSTVSAFLDLLASDSMVERSTERKTTILTICNYDSYQQREDDVPNDSPNDNRTIAERCPNELKNVKNVEEIYNNKSNHAYPREERVSWVAPTEQGFLDRFKATGCGMKVAKVTGKKADEIMRLLDAFMGKCELRNQGHRDFDHFNNRFLWAIENDWISLPAQQPQKKVTTNGDTYRLMQEMGWQDK